MVPVQILLDNFIHTQTYTHSHTYKHTHIHMLRTHDIDRSAEACLSACLANVLYLKRAPITHITQTHHMKRY